MGVFGGAYDPLALSVSDGLRVASACLPVALGCFIAGPAMGRVAANAIGLMAGNPKEWGKGILLCVTVEFYAILFLLASFLMLLNLNLGA
jgi:V/A-type H+-transporting ATPase subunit K